ncbi:hypothetical protein [Pseudoxanthobacter soli]|uniref:hypothetical protein n=1 Tax=Pseudoxanthobacter soli TaxID=433840 RepID=UPI001114BCF4|nr:hypothetical protein [Pseudoxanthobacter soli]
MFGINAGAFMFDVIISASATVAVGVLAYFQWLISHRAYKKQRDNEMVRWASDAMKSMSTTRLLVNKYKNKPYPENFHNLVDGNIIELSALIERGRLFFSNTDVGPEGYRPKILDEIVKYHHIAIYLSAGLPYDDRLIEHLEHSRKNFTRYVQRELGESIKRSAPKDAGYSIPKNPMDWRSYSS